MERSHLTHAHNLWHKILKKGSCAIDMTAGNGHDSFFIAKLILGEDEGELHIFDVQAKALENTRRLLLEKLPDDNMQRVFFHHRSHEEIAEIKIEKQPSLIVYNLGYLPGGDKAMTTKAASTINSLKSALAIFESCHISITAYPHEEGKREEKALMNFLNGLGPAYKVEHIRWKEEAPSLFWIEKDTVKRGLGSGSQP